MRLTFNQKRCLHALDKRPLTTAQIRYGAFPHTIITCDSIGHVMRRLEDRELVRRIEDNPIEWQLTAKGRKAIRPDYDEAHGHGIGPSPEYDDIEC